MNKVWTVVFLLSCLVLNLKAYYQQEVKYDIKVSLDDQKHMLHAFEEIVYINNSPDTLREIYMHLWPNAYQANTALDKQLVEDRNTLLYFGDQAYKGFIDSDKTGILRTFIPFFQTPANIFNFTFYSLAI